MKLQNVELQQNWQELASLDARGWDDKALLALSRPPNNLRRRPFWTAEVYGFGQYIRRYGLYPRWLPLCVSTDHGPSQQDEPLLSELECESPCHFYHSPRLLAEWRKVSTKACYVLYSPFVYYRRTYNIEQARSAKGTLILPTHSTTLVSDETDWRTYIEELLELPDEFKPLSACIYYHDILKGRHQIFREYRIPVYTAGNAFRSDFIERFYSILQQFRYSTSNSPGAYLFYSVEMGIPFFLYGTRPTLINSGRNKDFAPGEITTANLEQINKLHELFGKIRYGITSEQRKLVEYELGLTQGESRLKLATVLYYSFCKYSWRRFSKRIRAIKSRLTTFL